MARLGRTFGGWIMCPSLAKPRSVSCWRSPARWLPEAAAFHPADKV
jgi:hypothetical protein